MDALSRLLSLYPLSTALDVRCRFGAPWVLENDAATAGVAPYHLIISGTAWLDAAGTKGVALAPGDIVLFPKGGAHRLHVSTTGEPATPMRDLPGDQVVRLVGNGGSGPMTDILCGEFRFEPQAAGVLLAALPEVIVVHTAKRSDFGALRELITMLRLETETMQPGASMVVSQLASALFALVMRAWLEQAGATRGLFALLAERRLQPALHGLLSDPGKPWTLEEMARACNMSRATFARLFMRAAGDTPAKILLQTRMARAAQWLAQDTRSVGDIADAVGYQSEAAFSRVFKRTYGMGPGQYRRGFSLK
jgi:AraC family transcriptional regulator, activator of mtrCDE